MEHSVVKINILRVTRQKVKKLALLLETSMQAAVEAAVTEFLKKKEEEDADKESMDG